MTRKDYNELARIIDNAQTRYFPNVNGNNVDECQAMNASNLLTRWQIANAFCDIAQRDNARFNRPKFLTACGFE